MRISDWSSDVCSSDLVDDDVERAADLRRELLGRNPRRQFHQPGVALLLDLLGHRIGRRVGGGALDGFEAERADAVELRFLQPVHQVSEKIGSAHVCTTDTNATIVCSVSLVNKKRKK